MTIEEWSKYGAQAEMNAKALAYDEAVKRIAELEATRDFYYNELLAKKKRIAELEANYKITNELWEAANKDIAEKDERIAELEADLSREQTKRVATEDRIAELEKEI